MLRPSSVTRLLTFHTFPSSSAFRTCDVPSVLRRRTLPTQNRTQRSVATVVPETTGSQHSVLIHAPALKDIEDSEYEADPIPPEEIELGITQRAAEARFRLSSIPGPSLVTCQSASVPLLDAHTDPFYTATTSGLAARKQPQSSPKGNHRVWGVSWVPI